MFALSCFVDGIEEAAGEVEEYQRVRHPYDGPMKEESGARDIRYAH